MQQFTCFFKKNVEYFGYIRFREYMKRFFTLMFLILA